MQLIWKQVSTIKYRYINDNLVPAPTNNFFLLQMALYKFLYCIVLYWSIAEIKE